MKIYLEVKDYLNNLWIYYKWLITIVIMFFIALIALKYSKLRTFIKIMSVLVAMIIGIIGLRSIRIAAKSYRDTQSKNKFDYTMAVIKDVQENIDPLFSIDIHEKLIERAKIDILDSEFNSYKSSSHNTTSKELFDNILMDKMPEEINDSAKRRVIYGDIANLERWSIYLTSNHVDQRLAKNKLSHSIKLFYNNNKSYVQELKVKGYKLNRLEQLIREWNIV